MGLFSGSSPVVDVRHGSTEIAAVYSGANLVWVRELTTVLASADSFANSLTDSWDDQTNALDGNLSTYAGFQTAFGSTVAAGLDLTFPSIVASEVLEVRLLVKGRGTDGVSRTSTLAALSSGAGGHSAPQSSAIISFPPNGGIATYDSGLVSVDQAGSNSDVTWNFDASLFVGSSAGVLNWWGNSPRLRCTTYDFNFGGDGGRIYVVQLQVKYKPVY